MALGTTNITTTLIGTTLGISTRALSLLCTASQINMWSRCKPTRGVGSGSWQSNDGLYGFSLPLLSNPDTYTPTNWTYLHPTANYRIGDFRGYEHNSALTYPPVYSWGGATPGTIPTDLYPSDGPGNYPSTEFYFWASTNNTTRIKPIELSLDKYYFGVRYQDPAGTWWYKTATTTVDWRINENLATGVNVDVTISTDGLSFADAPFGVGTVKWELVVCSDVRATWSISKPTTVYKLPSAALNGVTMINSGTFTIHDWIIESVNNMIFGNSDTYSNYQSSIIHTSAAYWTVSYLPSFLHKGVYRGGILVTGVNPYISGDELRLWPAAVNTGHNLIDQVDISDTLSIDVEQYGHTPQINNWDTSGYPGLTVSNTSYSGLVVNSTDVDISFKPNISGTVYIQLWSDVQGYIGTSAPTSVTANTQKNFHITAGLTSTSINWGEYYTVYMTNGS